MQTDIYSEVTRTEAIALESGRTSVSDSAAFTFGVVVRGRKKTFNTPAAATI